MHNLELHLIETPHDEALAVTAGLIEPSDAGREHECLHCGFQAGTRPAWHNRFYGYVIVLETECFWVLCVECAAPVFDPGEELSA